MAGGGRKSFAPCRFPRLPEQKTTATIRTAYCRQEIRYSIPIVKGRVVFCCYPHQNLHTLPLDNQNLFPSIGCADRNRRTYKSKFPSPCRF